VTARLPRIEKRGALVHVVGPNGHVVGLGHARREDAEDSLGDLLHSSVRIIRTCMTRERPFESEGSHNRMCPPCKRRGG
jgi:hypothetical protein